MNRKKKGPQPRKPRIQRVASRKVEVPQGEIVVNRALPAIAVEFPLPPAAPSTWERVCSWCRDNPIDAVLAIGGLALSAGLVIAAAVLW